MSLEVLLVEDNPGDVRLMQEALRGSSSDVNLHVACDGPEALAFLRRQGSHAGAPRPSLILLDLNLPKLDGRQVLAVIKKDKALKTIPTVILTTSEAEADIDMACELRASCFVSKPLGSDALDCIVSSITDFWLTRGNLQ
jgi:two-component system, chemotaxis family, response regulator Rcp1